MFCHSCGESIEKGQGYVQVLIERSANDKDLIYEGDATIELLTRMPSGYCYLVTTGDAK